MIVRRLLSAFAVGLLVTAASLASPATEPAWQPVADAEYRILWRPVAQTRLLVRGDEPAPASGDILDPSYSKALEIEFDIAVSAWRFREISLETLVAAWPVETLVQRAEALSAFFDLYRDVDDGDVYTLRWMPNGGLELGLNGTPLGTVSDAEAASIILSIWLGPKPISSKQRNALLQEWQQRIGESS